MNKILMFLKTEDINTDDRVLKESHTLENSYNVTIACVQRRKNVSERKLIHESTNLRSFRIYTRLLFRANRGVILKAAETFITMSLYSVFNRSKIRWIHNPDMIGILFVNMLLKKFKIVDYLVWDLHELADDKWSQNAITKFIFRLALNGSDLIIHTNEDRVNETINAFGCRPKNTVVIENYVGYTFELEKSKSLNDNFISWRNERPYLVAQGGVANGRYFDNLALACKKMDIALVVIGNNNGHISTNEIFFTGYIDQKYVFSYLKNAKASVILYDENVKNNLFCSPNRLFQALECGTPVIVGRNPPMKRVVEMTRAGVVLETDGRSTDDIALGIQELVSNHSLYKNNSSQQNNKWRWESQEVTLLDALKKS